MMDVVFAEKMIESREFFRIGEGVGYSRATGGGIFYEFDSSGWPMKPFRETAWCFLIPAY
ncbi:MAG: hypothetical protein NPIRA06_21000 [Nitrospirales bacterium]|nr:MAG: hypothetical protein NPIRA06_21000 [Nitrospirales bacterium]